MRVVSANIKPHQNAYLIKYKRTFTTPFGEGEAIMSNTEPREHETVYRSFVTRATLQNSTNIFTKALLVSFSPHSDNPPAFDLAYVRALCGFD